MLCFSLLALLAPALSYGHPWYRHVTASHSYLHPPWSGVVAQLLAKCSKLQEAPNTRFAQILGLHLLLISWSLSPSPLVLDLQEEPGIHGGHVAVWQPVPVVGVDEQVQVAGVHVIHDVLAVSVDHLHVTLHLLLHLERGHVFPWHCGSGPVTTLSMLQVIQGQSEVNDA